LRSRVRGAAAALPAAALAAATLALAGCGSSASGESRPTLTVLAASSLTAALSEYGKEFSAADVRSSFAGSDQLAAQIRQGAPADVFASADTEYPRRLYGEGLVEKPIVFAHNRLVAIVPGEDKPLSLSELARPGTKIAIGEPGVPVGEYTREVLSRLPSAERQGILANVVSEEPEVTAVVAKVAAGAADAGFVYVTDAEAAAGEVRAVRLPERLQPDVAYAAAVVRHSSDPAAAKRYLSGLVSGAGAAALRRAGFLPP
jgi:molybdate transport system substrate-binding protein